MCRITGKGVEMSDGYVVPFNADIKDIDPKYMTELVSDTVTYSAYIIRSGVSEVKDEVDTLTDKLNLHIKDNKDEFAFLRQKMHTPQDVKDLVIDNMGDFCDAQNCVSEDEVDKKIRDLPKKKLKEYSVFAAALTTIWVAIKTIFDF